MNVFLISKKKFNTICSLIFLLIVYIFIGSKIKNSSSAQMLNIAEVLTFVIYAVSFFCWFQCTKKIASLYFILFVYCFLFNAGQILLGVFNINFVGIVNIFKLYSNTQLLKMMLFQCECILAVTIGAIIAYCDKPYEDINYENDIISRDGMVGLQEIFFIATTLVLELLYLKEVFTRSSSSYGDYYYGERTGVSILALFLYHVLMYKILLEHNKDVMSKFAWLSNGVLVMLMLLIGSRNAVIQIIFGVLFLTVYVKKHSITISWKKLLVYIGAAIVLVIAFSGIQDLRQYSFGNLSFNVISDVYSKGLFTSLTDSLVQMGGSARCIIQTMQQIDSGSVSSEPTIFYALGKGIVNVRILSLFGFTEPTNYSLSAWITEVGGSQSGWGYSILAEAYYNFQNAGFIFMAIWGFAFVKLEQFALKLIHRGSNLCACSLVYVLAYAIFMARADMCLISSRMRYCLYVFILYYVWKYSVGKKYVYKKLEEFE